LIIVSILSDSNALRIILGIPFLLFFPGYTLMAALFTKKEGMSGVERVALSFGLSIAIVPLIGLILNYTPWGIRLEPILYSVALFILITSIIAWLRQISLTESERSAFEFQVKMPGWGGGVQDKILTIALVIVILGLLGTVVYVIATPKIQEAFTEFYILGQEGKAADYPIELNVGDEGRVIVGITNHEGDEIDYRIEVFIDNEKVTEIGSIVLVNGQNIETGVVFVPNKAGQNQKLEFLLYKNNEVEPCMEPLYLWIDVS